MGEDKAFRKQASDSDARRSFKDRRKEDLPFEGPDRRTAPGGFVIEIHRDGDGKPRAMIRRKKHLDRRRPVSPFDHQK